VPKRKRREQQHRDQESSRRRQFQVGGSAPNEVYKPGFPMNIFGNIKLFAIIGVVIAIILVVTAVFTRQSSSSQAENERPTPTPTATVDPNATPTPSVAPSATAFTAAEPVTDPAKKYYVTLKTSMGDVVLKLDPSVGPNTVNSFVFLAEKGFFNGITFHRVAKDFVIQSGDPTGSGTGGPGYQTDQEPNQLRNKKYTISMAKVGNATNFGSQFFINLRDNPSLDFDNGRGSAFYPFGEVVEGKDVVDAIGGVATTPPVDGKPNQPITITSATVEAKDN
jgi:cyclophilin family peptidyl-prolyl cis-trans isomerase